MRCGIPTTTWSQWISMPIVQRREASKGCGCRHSIGRARACSTSHEWRGSPPIGPSASTRKTFGKYHLNFPAIVSAESRKKGRRCEGEQVILPPATPELSLPFLSSPERRKMKRRLLHEFEQARARKHGAAKAFRE